MVRFERFKDWFHFVSFKKEGNKFCCTIAISNHVRSSSDEIFVYLSKFGNNGSLRITIREKVGVAIKEKLKGHLKLKKRVQP